MEVETYLSTVSSSLALDVYTDLSCTSHLLVCIGTSRSQNIWHPFAFSWNVLQGYNKQLNQFRRVTVDGGKYGVTILFR